MGDAISKVQEALTNPYLMIGLVMVILFFSFKLDFVSLAVARFVGPASVVNAFPEPEPNATEACFAAGGICIPAQQKVLVGTADYGACDSLNKCLVRDLCEATGGRYVYPMVTLTSFQKRCECPLPSEYKLLTGCTQPYGTGLDADSSYPQAGCPYFEARYVSKIGKCVANLEPVPCEDNGGLYNFGRYWCEWNPTFAVKK